MFKTKEGRYMHWMQFWEKEQADNCTSVLANREPYYQFVRFTVSVSEK